MIKQNDDDPLNNHFNKNYQKDFGVELSFENQKI